MTILADHLPPDDIDALIEPVCQLADLDTSREGGHVDPLMDDLILAARKIRDREGFLVTDGDELDDPGRPVPHHGSGPANQ